MIIVIPTAAAIEHEYDLFFLTIDVPWEKDDLR
jgi:hypothetical protein